MQVSLPPSRPVRQFGRHEDGWSDHYGALHVAAAYSGFELPSSYDLKGVWQHGVFGPWQRFSPHVLVYNAPGAADRPVFVARQDQKELLQQHGYRDVHAIGLPIAYVPEPGVQRLPGSLLVIPTHTLTGDQYPDRTRFEEYVASIQSVAERFSRVVACIHPNCQRNGLWVREFTAANIEIVYGADTSDANALLRMRMLWAQFEFVTSNDWGSHVAYALAFGCRVSLSGLPIVGDSVSQARDEMWKGNAAVMATAFSPEVTAARNAYLRRLFVSPVEGVADEAWGRWLIGADHRLSPEQMGGVLTRLVEPRVPISGEPDEQQREQLKLARREAARLVAARRKRDAIELLLDFVLQAAATKHPLFLWEALTGVALDLQSLDAPRAALLQEQAEILAGRIRSGCDSVESSSPPTGKPPILPQSRDLANCGQTSASLSTPSPFPNPIMTSETPAGRVYPGLPAPSVNSSFRKARICIVSNEFVGPSRNGGIGTAYTVLAETLAAAGHEVTCLYSLGGECASHDIAYWQAQYEQRGIQLVPLTSEITFAQIADFAAASCGVYHWLKRNERFDFIHFPECQALGYYTQLAKLQGLAFAGAEICVGLHSMLLWIREANREYHTSQFDLQLHHMERASVEMADMVWSPSQYLINWIGTRGWKLPERCYVQPYIMPHSARAPRTAIVGPSRPVDEFVFFGRLETRKGLALFCDALDRLRPEAAARVKQVTFLGREALVDGVKAVAFIKQRAKKWRWRTQVIVDKNQPEAVAYMRGHGRLAIMPSLMENSPNTVYECLGGGLAFLASRAGGIPELIHADDVDRICFDLNPAALAGKLSSVLGKFFCPGRLAFDADANEKAWIRWHGRELPACTPAREPEVWPKVSLCLTTFNRPQLLLQAIESIEAMTYPNLEVVLVDDGSTQPEALTIIEQLEPRFARRGWRIVRQENRYPGAARNNGAKHATGEYFLFMDDDNYAEPHELATLVRAMLVSGADILTCGMFCFQGQERPERATEGKRIGSLPIGCAVAAGAFANVFGDTNALVRRQCFENLGGFTEDYGVTHEGWEFHARAVLKGYKLQVVPEFLFWHRVDADSLLRTSPVYLNHMRSLRPYLEAMPPELRELALYAKGLTQVYVDPLSSPAIADYLRLSLLWRAKVEAGRELAALGRPEEAARVMLAGIKSVETCKQPLILLEALLGVGENLIPLDSGRARYLLGLATKFAENLHRPKDREQAQALLATLG